MKKILIGLTLLASMTSFAEEIEEEFVSRAITICSFVTTDGTKHTMLKNHTDLNDACAKHYCAISGQNKVTFHAILAGESIKNPKNVTWGEYTHVCRSS